MPRTRKLEPFILQAALTALERQREQVDQRIAQVRAWLGRQRAGAAPSKVRPARRSISLAARKRIAEAQRRRWAEYRAEREKEAPAQAAKPRRRKPGAVKQAGAET